MRGSHRAYSLFLVMIALILVGAAVATADEAEERAARAAEENPASATGAATMAPDYSEAVWASSELLFIAVDDSTVSTYVVDPADNNTQPAFSGTGAWGAALIPGASPGDGVVYFNDGSSLYRWPANGSPALCCTLMFNSATATVVSMAYDPAAGELLFTRNITTEAVYSLPVTAGACPATCDLSQDIVYSSALDIGGLAYDPVGMHLYGTDDSGANVVEINGDGSTTVVTAYPVGQTDIDGLTYGNGKLYLVTDEPGSTYVYDIGTASYETPLTNPWTTAELFSAAAFGAGLIIPAELQSFAVE